jgi:hypothetical protein
MTRLLLLILLALFASSATAMKHHKKIPKPLCAAQQKILPVGAAGDANLGAAASMSATGSLLAVGADNDNNETGAVFVFRYQSSTQKWLQLGRKLTGSTTIGAGMGTAVGMSGNGKVIVAGAPFDNDYTGAAYVFQINSDGVFVSPPLATLLSNDNLGIGASAALDYDGTLAVVGSGSGTAYLFYEQSNQWHLGFKFVTPSNGLGDKTGFGSSVAMSADGNTIVIGDVLDNDAASGFNRAVGAAWVYTNIGGGIAGWNTGYKLVGTGRVGPSQQGISCAISADGQWIAVGGWTDDNGRGAVWVYHLINSIWTQAGSKLVATGGIGHSAAQGTSVAFDEYGTTLWVGAQGDDKSVGAVWVWQRSPGGTAWVQRIKLVGAGYINVAGTPNPHIGTAVALNYNATVGATGGYTDDGGVGAAWVYSNCSS